MALADGSGSVTVELHLDPEAAAAVPNLKQQLRTADLKSSGWSMEGPLKTNNETVVRITRPFASPREADAVLSQLTGPDGAFHDFHVSQTRSLFRVRTTVAGSVDLTRGVNSFGDDTLVNRVGSPLGIDPAELQRSLGVDWQQDFPVDVTVHVPGRLESSTPLPDTGNTWHLTYGSATVLHAEASGLNAKPIVLLVFALVFLCGAVAVAVFWKPVIHRPQHRKGGPAPRRRSGGAGPQHRKGGPRARDLLSG